VLALKNGLHGAVDGDLLVIARGFSGKVEVRREQQLAGRGGNALRLTEAFPEVVRRRELRKFVISPRGEIVLDDAVAVGGVRKLEAQNLRVIFGLLEAVTGLLVGGLGFHDGNGEIAPVSK